MKLKKGRRQQSKRFRKKHQDKGRSRYSEKCSIQDGSKQEGRKMKLEDVQKMSQAGPVGTRSPIRVEYGTNLVDRKGRSLVGLQTNYAFTLERNTANAALLAHWWNHGPKLLEALKEEVKNTQDRLCSIMNQEDCPEHIQMALGPMVATLHNRTFKTIQAAQEVEGI